MSDLLARMIARAARPVSDVAPAVPSRYEAASVSPELPVVFEESRIVEAPRALASPARGQHEAPEPPAGVPRLDQDAPQFREPIATSITDDFTELQPPAHVRRTTAPASEDRTEPRREQHRPMAIPSPAPTSIAESLPKPLAEWVAPLGDLDPMAAPALQPSPPPVPQRRRTASPELRREAALRGPEPQPSFEVHVSIGHIEVRQAPAAAPPRPRQAPAPHLRLEEYLKRRGGEAR